MNCNVERAMNGVQAVEKLMSQEFHLIISDVRMPGMDGFDLFEWVGNNRPELTDHFLFITGDAGNAEMHDKLNKVAAPVLRKPFSLDSLVEESRKLLVKKHVVETHRVKHCCYLPFITNTPFQPAGTGSFAMMEQRSI